MMSSQLHPSIIKQRMQCINMRYTRKLIFYNNLEGGTRVDELEMKTLPVLNNCQNHTEETSHILP